MTERALIKTYGHCGSMFVHYWLSNNQNYQLYGYEQDHVFTPETPDFASKNNISIHTHDYWLPNESFEKWRFIHVYRKDVFSQAISSLISNYTKQSVKYDDKVFAPVYIDEKYFNSRIRDILYFDKIFDLQSTLGWKATHKLCFEDFIQNPDIALQILKHEDSTKSFYKNPKVSVKNPRKHDQVISNYYDLLDYYNKNYDNQIKKNRP